ncbi:MAG: DUF1385 domain-containing protein [Clostridia bacterium]|nr:DUF1385 domain-containing protein [Clostridia bacterium]
MSKQKECVLKKTSIGGQALIEGVMMRGPERTAMAVRHVSGEIRMEEWDNPQKKRFFLIRWPFIRGIFNFISSLTIGMKCLMKSAEMSGLEEELEDAMTEENALPEDATEEQIAAAEAEKEAKKKAAEKKAGTLMNIVMVVGMILGVALSLVLFMWLPIQLFNLLVKVAPAVDKAYFRGVFEGVMRIIIFLGYMILVSRMKDIRRTFMYHGAEHKSIFCYEKGLPLTVENVREQKRFHPRCGTSFMILMLIVGIIISICLPITHTVWRTMIKIALLPLTVGIGYELIKLAGRHDNWFTRFISAPGVWVQHITTVEPDDDMIECAIKALEAVIPEDKEADKW